ncbi:MAG: hypothetical protein ACK57A_06035, partial [Gemmatimonas sp.]
AQDFDLVRGSARHKCFDLSLIVGLECSRLVGSAGATVRTSVMRRIYLQCTAVKTGALGKA